MSQPRVATSRLFLDVNQVEITDEHSSSVSNTAWPCCSWKDTFLRERHLPANASNVDGPMRPQWS
jgi:hypothetical protein